MEIEKKYAILMQNFEENYSFNGKKEENFLFRVLRLNYRIKNNNYNVEIQNKLESFPRHLHRFALLRFFRYFFYLNIPVSISFFSQKITFASRKDEKKCDFSFTTLMEFGFKEKISFYFCYPSISDIKRLKKILNLILDDKLKIVSEIPKNLPVIFGEGSGGVLFHEIISHPLEGDVFKNTYYKNKLGEKISRDFLTVYDDPTFKGLPICRKFDDEGENCSRKPLLEKGILKNILCNNYYSRIFLFPPGNARVCLDNPIPLPRATNTIVEANKKEDLSPLNLYPNFLFIPFIKKASFSPPDRIYLIAGPAYYYLNKKKYGKILNLKIEGNIGEFLSGIDFLGGKLKNCITFGTCLKDGGKLFVGAASPDVSFINLRYTL